MEELYKTVDITKLLVSTSEAANMDRSAFFFDTTGEADKIFRYSGKVCDMRKLHNHRTMGVKSLENVKQHI